MNIVIAHMCKLHIVTCIPLQHMPMPITSLTLQSFSDGSLLLLYLNCCMAACIINNSGQTCPSCRSLRVLGVCQLVGHRLVMPLLLRPQLVMHWLVMHALAKDSPGLPGDVSVTDLPCPCRLSGMQQGGGPVHTKPRSLTCTDFSPSLHLPTFCCIPLYIIIMSLYCGKSAWTW